MGEKVPIVKEANASYHQLIIAKYIVCLLKI